LFNEEKIESEEVHIGILDLGIAGGEETSKSCVYRDLIGGRERKEKNRSLK
jgi:hypothetical protein